MVLWIVQRRMRSPERKRKRAVWKSTEEMRTIVPTFHLMTNAPMPTPTNSKSAAATATHLNRNPPFISTRTPSGKRPSFDQIRNNYWKRCPKGHDRILYFHFIDPANAISPTAMCSNFQLTD